MERKLVTVAVDGSAEFTTLTAAAAAQDPAQPLHFVLGAGTYYERPFLELADYIITGAGMGQTVISAGAAGRDPWPGEERTGTFRSQTLFLGGGSARLEHLTVENTAGDGADRGQALAVYADASRVCMVDVSLHGNQDTLFTAPLPLAVRQKNSFRSDNLDAFRRELDTLGTPHTLIDVTTPENQQRDALLTLFETLTDAMQDDACYYADATFGTKTYPLVLASALRYAEKILDDTEVCGIYYRPPIRYQHAVHAGRHRGHGSGGGHCR